MNGKPIPEHKEEIIRGTEAIREAIQEWRQFLIKEWRNEPLRLAQAIPYGAKPLHIVEFQDGRKAWFGYLGNDMRYPLYWGCNTVSFMDGTEVPRRLAIGLYDFDPHEVETLHSIARIIDTLPVIYDPVLLLFWHLADATSSKLTPEQPISASEIVAHSETLWIPRTPQAALNIGWLRVRGHWYPIELITIARERI